MKKVLLIVLILLLANPTIFFAFCQNENVNSTKPSTEIAQKVNEKNIKQMPDDTKKIIDWLKIIGLVTGVIIIGTILVRYLSKCPSCKKWYAMNEISKICISQRPTMIKEELKTKNANGDVIRSREVNVPGVINTYQHHYKCKYCGYENIKTTTETVKS